MDKEMMAKVEQDAEAYARSLAAKRGRNVEWAARAVRQSVSVTADEALKANVIDVVADNVDSLLAQVNNKVVDGAGKKVTLKTEGARIHALEMPFKYKFLSFMSDPNVAYLLMMIGFYGILFEVFRPGAIVPGVLGGICLILALLRLSDYPHKLRRPLPHHPRHHLLSSRAEDGELRRLERCGRRIHCDRLYNARQPALELAFHIVVVHTGTVAIVSIVFFLGMLSYAVKAQMSGVRTGREGTGRRDRDRANRCRHLRQGVRPRRVVGRKKRVADTCGRKGRVVAVEGMSVKVKKEGGN